MVAKIEAEGFIGLYHTKNGAMCNGGQTLGCAVLGVIVWESHLSKYFCNS